MGSQENENPSWVVFDDYSLIEDSPVSSLLDSAAFASTPWPHPHHLSFSAPTSLSVENGGSLAQSDIQKQIASRKRVRSETCGISGSKACREKMRRDRLNDRHPLTLYFFPPLSLSPPLPHVEFCIILRFLELSSILDPGRAPKMDKAVILGDAVCMVTQLRGEAQKLKETKENLQEKINELKEEKNELRDEKQRLKTQKEKFELQVKALSSQPGFLPHPPAIPTAFSAPGQVVGSKLVPFMGYAGVSMWQFMPSTSFDTSQDHVLRPPVA